jgi:hypothetical protein
MSCQINIISGVPTVDWGLPSATVDWGIPSSCITIDNTAIWFGLSDSNDFTLIDSNDDSLSVNL